ncbi:hypothetical protein FB451DRAFT_1399027 [Mycena latifolia]|nr:hypothetical protein FB451DRAFT_1399027 [Mycena latifolia]
MASTARVRCKPAPIVDPDDAALLAAVADDDGERIAALPPRHSFASTPPRRSTPRLLARPVPDVQRAPALHPPPRAVLCPADADAHAPRAPPPPHHAHPPS